MPETDPREGLVLVFAPTGRDARLIAGELGRRGLAALVCTTLDEFCDAAEAGAGAAVLAEEALPPAGLTRLLAVLDRQPPWSDLPLLVLTGKGAPSAASVRRFEALEPAANVTQLERPVRTRTLVSAVRAALRARRRQYDVRGHLAERDRLLREGEAERARLAEVFRHAPSFMCVLRGPDHVFERANDRYHELVGRRDILGRTVREALPEVEGQGFLGILDRVYRTGEAFVSPGTRITLVRGDGPEERVLEFVYQPLRDAAGAVTGILANGVDLTDRERAQAGLARVTAESDRQRRMFDTALSHTADFVYLFDPAGRFTYANKALLDLWGKGLPEAAGKTFRELGYTHEQDALLRGQVQEVVRTRQPLRGETSYAGARGTRAHEYIFVPVFGAAGAVEGVAGSTRDITERKGAEEALRRSEERYRVLVTASSDVVYRMSADWAEMYPLDGRDLVPSSTAGALRGWMERNLPAFEHARVTEAILEAVSRKATFELEHQVLRPDGTLGWTHSRAAPILDGDGGIVEWFGTARDVTDRKQAADELARVTAESDRRKRLYEAVLSAIPDFVYVFSLDHRILYANDALVAMWGYGPEETAGKTFRELGYEPWHADLHAREIDAVRATRRPIRGEVPFTGTLGRRIYDYIFVPVFGTTGEVEAVAGTTRDVTDRQAMEQQLRDADRKKDDFLALLAHELRNPLAPIRNGLQVLRLADDRAVRRRSQDMMDRQLAHMVRLIDDLLDVSRISRNKMELRRARLLLADAVASAVETARPAVDAAGHDLSVSLPEEPVFLDADLTRLAQVFGNLLTNSAKYTPPGGRIWLAAEARDGLAVVTVRDTGIGIPAESLPAIFDMFSQVDRSIEKSTGGLGIGLALVKGLVEMHGGTVAAESAGQGRGSAFTVRLPLLAAAPVAESGAAEPARAAGPARRILVVDDNRDSAESMAEMLRLLGNEVAVAHDGLEAVEAAGRVRPEVVLMDVGMPRLNGFDATRRIRGEPWGRDIVIVALTGWGQDGDRAQSREAGCDGHLVKPVDLGELEGLLASLTPGRRSD